jgi:small subunit ribosomal protein S1
MASDDDFAALFEQQLKSGKDEGTRKLERGQVVQGTVVAIGEDVVFVDVGTKSEGRVERNTLLDDKGTLRVAVGDKLRLTVVRTGGREPMLLAASLGGAGVDAATLDLARQSGTPVEGEITKAVKAGLEVDVGGVRAFCPASQIEIGYAGDLAAYVGQRHFFRVLEVRDNGRSVVLSRKALLQAEREQKGAELLGRLEVGAEMDGIVQSIQPYGVFVDLGGVEGMVHVSELAHNRVASPNDVVSVGEQVRVKVLSIEPNPGGKGTRLSLSMKALVQPEAAPSSDEILTGTVGRIEHHGIWVDTPQGGGFVPVAELGLPPGSDPKRGFQVGATLEVVVLRRDNNGKLRLSVRGVAEAESRRNFRDFRSGEGSSSRSLGSLGDLLRDKIPPSGELVGKPVAEGSGQAPAEAAAESRQSRARPKATAPTTRRRP